MKMSQVKNALAKKTTQAPKQQQRKSIQQLIIAMKPQIEKALPEVMTPERFTRITLTALSSNPKLQDCTGESFMGAMMQAAQLGLEPNTPLGQAYLIPYGNQCQFQIGYKGLIDLAYRSGEFTQITAEAVYENDEFHFEYGLNSDLVHKPALTNRGEVIAYYGLFKLKNGGYSFIVMSKEDIEKFAKQYSQPYKQGRNTPWKTDFDSMAKKTVLKQVLKYAPIRTEFARQISADESVKTELSSNMLDVDDEFYDIEVKEANQELSPGMVDEDTEELFEGMTNAELDAEIIAQDLKNN